MIEAIPRDVRCAGDAGATEEVLRDAVSAGPSPGLDVREKLPPSLLFR